MEESAAHGKGIAEEAVGVIDEVLSGMDEKSEQVEGKQDGREVLLPMTKVMFEAST